jgi:hypothetical protein
MEPYSKNELVWRHTHHVTKTAQEMIRTHSRVVREVRERQPLDGVSFDPAHRLR